MLNYLILFAPSGGDGQGSMLGTLVMFGLIFFIFYFMIIRPQQKREKQRQSMLEAVKKGDKIVTSGGIHGSVIGLEDKTLLVQVADNVKLKIERSAVALVTKESGSSDSK